MRETTELYKEIVATGSYDVETRLSINGAGVSDSLRESSIFSLKTNRRLFATDTPSIGNCVSGTITAEIFQPDYEIPRSAELRIYVRVRSKDGSKIDTTWMRKGTFFIDTRTSRKMSSGRTITTLTGYDAMLRAEEDFAWDVLKKWPALDINVVKKIAQQMGVSLDPRTEEIIVKGYEIPIPDGYSCREILGNIATMYGGNFIMSDLGQLLLVQLNNVPRESLVLLNEDGVPILFGGEPVLV